MLRLARPAVAVLACSLFHTACGGTSEDGAQPGTSSDEAAAAYEEGLAALNSRRSQGETEEALAAFQRATEADAEFAAAWSGVAQSRMWLRWIYGVPDQLTEAEAAAARAAELAPDSKDTHLALGYVDYYGRGDLSGALGHFQAAEAIDPNDAQIAGAIGNIHRRRGEFDDAILAYERRIEIEPDHTQGMATLAGTYQSVGRHADAMAIADRLDEMGDPRGPVQHFWSSFHTGDTARAWEQIPVIQEAQGRAGQPGYFAFLQAYARDDVAGANALVDQIGTDDIPNGLRSLMAIHLGTTGQAAEHAAVFDGWVDRITETLFEDPSTDLERALQASRRADLALLEALRGNRDGAMAHIAAVEAIDPMSIDVWRSGPITDITLARAVLGENDGALAGIQELVQRRLALSTGWLAFSPSFDGIRDDPRFQALVDQRAAMEQPAM